LSLRKTTDFLIIGAGIIGMAIARELRACFPDQSVTVLEKESEPGFHASGRNSGVLHAGFYYTADSLKARFCRDGNREWTDYCLQHGLPINRCGKVVVTRNAEELQSLDELLRRGRANGVELQPLDEKQLADIEPRARTFSRALFSPATSSIDPQVTNQHLYQQLRESGVHFSFNNACHSHKKETIRTAAGTVSAGYVINTAGLHADRIARDFGFSDDYTILPFKGLYLYANDSLRLSTHIYPVPDLNNPFLGVHFTVTAAGKTKLGPTAIPAFWREHYHGLRRFNLRECREVVRLESSLLFRNSFGFRDLALHEMSKYYKPRLVRLAAPLVDDLRTSQFTHWGRAGIRAQLLNIKTRLLEMDFRCEGDEHSMHVLNAVSPAYTCAFPFARYVVDKIRSLRK